MGYVDQRVQTFSYKIISYGDVTYSKVTLVKSTILFIRNLIRVVFKCPHHIHIDAKNGNCDRVNMLINLTRVISVQWIYMYIKSCSTPQTVIIYQLRAGTIPSETISNNRKRGTPP